MNNLEQVNRFIFTGTPGSGKTSVILVLKRLGYVVIPVDVYKKFGFEMVFVSNNTIEKRCEFILEVIGNSKG